MIPKQNKNTGNISHFYILNMFAYIGAAGGHTLLTRVGCVVLLSTFSGCCFTVKRVQQPESKWLEKFLRLLPNLFTYVCLLLIYHTACNNRPSLQNTGTLTVFTPSHVI